MWNKRKIENHKIRSTEDLVLNVYGKVIRIVGDFYKTLDDEH